MLEKSLNQQPTEFGIMNYKFVGCSEEDCNWLLWRTLSHPWLVQRACKLVRYKSLAEEHTAQERRNLCLSTYPA